MTTLKQRLVDLATKTGYEIRALHAQVASLGAWGSITGSIASQSDLQTALGKKFTVITPQQYGAVGDGVTDDLAAIVAAWNAAKAAKSRMRIPAPSVTYKLSGTWTIDADGCDIEGDGWQYTSFTTSGAFPAIILNSKYGRVSGIQLQGNGVGNYGLIVRDANSTVWENCDIRGFTTDGMLLDPTYGGGAPGNNNGFRVRDGSSVSNGGRGCRMVQNGNNNLIEYDGFNCSGNTSDGMLLKSEGWHIRENCLLEGNGGYGAQVGEDADTSLNQNGKYDAPWNESNALGGVRSTAKAGNNAIKLKSSVTTYSRHASAVDLVDWISGGVYYFASSDGDSALRASANSTSAFLYGASKSGTVNVTLHLGAAGTGFVQSDFDFNIDTGKVLKVGNTQVVGARQTGCPAAATDLASAITLLNFLRSAGLTHGLIS